MNKQTVLERAKAAVSAVDGLLTRLDKLTNDAQTLSASIAALQNDEADLLKSEATEEQKVKSLLKVRATIDVKSAALKKLQAEIGAVHDEVRVLGDKANLFVGAVHDALVASRRAKVSEHLKALFIAQAQLELQRFLPYSLAVHEIETGIDRLQWYPAAQADRNVSTARNVRSTFDQLATLAEAEENLEIIASESW